MHIIMDEKYKSLDIVFNTLANLLIIGCILAIVTIPLAVWKIIDLIIYLVY